MRIIGTEGMSGEQVAAELSRGGKFVIFQYTISIIVRTFKRSSNIYFIRPGENSVVKGLPFSLISLMFGWWGIPWGPVYTIQSLVTNLQGGKDVTQEILATLRNRAGS